MKKIVKLLILASVLFTFICGCGTSDSASVPEKSDFIEIADDAMEQVLETEHETEDVVQTEIESAFESVLETEVISDSEVESETMIENTQETVALPVYTYAEFDKVMYAMMSINVRDLPSMDGNKLGRLSDGQEVSVTGQCNETSWYRINFNGGMGFVSNKYLLEEKPVAPTPQPTSEPTPQPQPEPQPEPQPDNGGGAEVTTPSSGGGDMVWIPTNGGKKFHSHSGCSNMKDPRQVSRGEAEALGFTACKRCW